MLTGPKTTLIISWLDVKNSGGTILSKLPSWSGERLQNKCKNTARLSGKEPMNYLRNKGLSNKFRLERKKLKTGKPIMSFLNGRQLDATKSILTPVCIPSSSPNFIPSKPIVIWLKTYTRWGSKICQWSGKKSEKNLCSGSTTFWGPELNLNLTKDFLVSTNSFKKKKTTKNTASMSNLTKTPRKNKKRKNKKIKA